MRIDGEWYECDDAIVRPIVRAEVLSVHGRWEPVLMLVDTGADRTVLTSATLRALARPARVENDLLGGVGGITDAVVIRTEIRLWSTGAQWSVFRGEYAGLRDLESLDMCVLGRDVLGHFAVVVDRPGKQVSLVRGVHRYRIDPS